MPLPQFPPEALQVLRIIRAEVPRPWELPIFGNDDVYFLRWDDCNDACPMGLHTQSTKPDPGFAYDFAGGRCSQTGVNEFGIWWDSIDEEDAPAAVDFVWKVA